MPASKVIEMNKKLHAFLVLSAMSLCWGCAPVGDDSQDDPGEEEPIAEARLALAASNAAEMNGTLLNSSFLNGIKFNGIKFNGIKFNGIKFNGTDLEGTREDNGITVNGTGFAGTDMDAVLGDSTTTTVRVESATTGEVTGMVTYEIRVGGTNVCASGGKALLLPGRWDYATGTLVDDTDKFTVACRGAAIAKCSEWGYNDFGKWTESNGTEQHDISLKYFHQACVRMVRADYCGDGVSHTETGTSIELYDTADIQTESPGNTLALEAEWSAGGATCVKHVRWTATNANPSQTVEDYIDDNCPSRWAGPSSTSCGGATSEYFTANGFKSSPSYVANPATRPFLRNASDQHTH